MLEKLKELTYYHGINILFQTAQEMDTFITHYLPGHRRQAGGIWDYLDVCLNPNSRYVTSLRWYHNPKGEMLQTLLIDKMEHVYGYRHKFGVCETLRDPQLYMVDF